MNETQCLQSAEKYLLSHGIEHLPPGMVGRREESCWEITFLIPETVNPEIATVDPPDVRVWVSIPDHLVELICQM